MSTKRRINSSKRKNAEQLDANAVTGNTVSGSEVKGLKTTQDVSNLSAFANISHKNSSGANNWSKFTEVLKQTSHKAPKPKFKKSQLQTVNLVPESKTNFQTKLPNVKRSTFDKTQNNGFIENMPNRAQDKNINSNTKFTSRHEISKPVLTKHIAMDCEMVGVEMGVNKNMLARISLVNSHGDCIYDKFVKPTEPVLDYRTRVSGVRAEDLENATDFKIVQKEVSDIMKGRILVGHALKNDLKVLYLSHPKFSIRDTSRFQKFREGKTPALKKLAKKYLGVVIQEGEHSSTQDALAAMQLYKMFKKEWESSIFSKKHQVKKDVKNKPSEPSRTQSVEVI